MERLHSGGRKFVVLDFGAPILLTDVYIPACPDWVSITVDIWNRTDRSKNDSDLVRLAISTDINRRPVILHDLQPSVICRFLRLTITGRQGLSATSCKTSIGSFYGHSLILPNDLIAPAMHAEHIPILGREEILVSFMPFYLLHRLCSFAFGEIGEHSNAGSAGGSQPVPLQFSRRSATEPFAASVDQLA